MVRGNKKGIGLGTIAPIRAYVQQKNSLEPLILMIIK
jgi:hypothetical protein